jgi:hypothetical protein
MRKYDVLGILFVLVMGLGGWVGSELLLGAPRTVPQVSQKDAYNAIYLELGQLTKGQNDYTANWNVRVQLVEDNDNLSWQANRVWANMSDADKQAYNMLWDRMNTWMADSLLVLAQEVDSLNEADDWLVGAQQDYSLQQYGNVMKDVSEADGWLAQADDYSINFQETDVPAIQQIQYAVAELLTPYLTGQGG